MRSSRTLPGSIATRSLAGLALAWLLSACGAPCETPDALGPLVSAPRWVVRFNDRPPSGSATPSIPGIDEPIGEPVGSGAYAALGLYGDPSGTTPPALLHERWLDSSTAWERANGRLDAASRLPTLQREGELLFLLGGGTRNIVSLRTAGSPGTVALDVPTRTSAGATGGHLVDLAPIDLPEIPGAAEAIASRQRGSDGVGDDVVLLDLRGGAGEEAGIVRRIGLSSLSTGDVVGPGQVVALPNELGVADRALVTLTLPGESNRGAVAIVTPQTGAVSRFELPGLSGCAWAARLSPAPSAPSIARVAVACVGDVTLPPSERRLAGLVLLTVPPDAGPSVEATRPLSSLFSEHAPTGPMVALAGDWIAIVARGTADGLRPDALLAFDLSSDAGRILWEERWTEAYGVPLGEGDFAADLGAGGELWWPSATGGIRRWEMRGIGPGAELVELEGAGFDVPLPACSRMPPRVVRRLPGPSAPPPPLDAGDLDAGDLDAGVDAGDLDAGAPMDAGSDAAP